MVKNTQMQEHLDKIKWATSANYKCDMSGKMEYCKFCDKAKDEVCIIPQDKRIEGSLCAKAFNKMKKGGANNG